MTTLDFRFKDIKICFGFPQKVELRNIFGSCRMFMRYSLYIKQPKPMCEMKLNMIFDEDPDLTNSLNRFQNQPLNRKISHIRFVNKKGHIIKNTNDYDNITSSNYTDILNNYDNRTLPNCTNNENNIDIFIPTLLLTVPCGRSFLCLMNLMVYTLIKPLFKFN